MSLQEDRVPDLLDTPDAGPAAIRGGAVRTAGYAAGLLLALASAPLIFRHLGKVEFGRYSAVLALVLLAVGFTEGGMNAIAQREWATRTPADRQRVLANLLGIRLVLTAIAIVAALAFALVAGYGTTLVAGTAVAGVALIATSAQSLLASPLQADLRFGWATAADLTRQITLVLCIVGLVVAGAGILPLLAAQLPAALAALTLTAWLVHRDVPLRPQLHREVWAPLLRDTLPYAIAIALNAAYFRVAILFMSVVASAAALGDFATSYRIVEVVIVVPPVLLGAAFPILSRAARDDAGRFAYVTGRTFEVALAVGGLAAVGLVLGAELAIDLLAGPGYSGAVPVLQIQGPAVLATFAAVACQYPLLSLREHRAVLLVNGISLVAVLVLLAVLVPPFGAHGAAIATLAAEVVLASASAIALVRRHRSVSLSLAAIVLVPALAAASIGVAFALGLGEVARVVVGVVLYGLGLLVTGRIPRELLDAVRR